MLQYRKMRSSVNKRLHILANSGDGGGVRSLLRNRANPDTLWGVGTPLHKICGACSSLSLKKSLETTEVLLDAGANPDLPNRHGQTPLLVATSMGNAALVWRLLAEGADIDHVNNQGFNAFALAAKRNDVATCAVLNQYGGVPHLAQTKSTLPLGFQCDLNGATLALELNALKREIQLAGFEPSGWGQASVLTKSAAGPGSSE